MCGNLLFGRVKSVVIDFCVCVLKVLCPRCETGSQKSKSKKAKEGLVPCKKADVKLDSLFDVEKVLSTSKDTASAVSHFLVQD